MTRAFRQSPNTEYARAATRSLRTRFDQRTAAEARPYVSFFVLPLFALANAGVRLDARHSRRPRLLPGHLGRRRRPGDRQVRRHHRRDRPGAGHGLGCSHRDSRCGASRAAPRSPASGSPSRCSSSTWRSTIPRKQDQARVGVLAASVLALVARLGDLPVADWLSPPVAVGAKLLATSTPTATTSGALDAPLTLVEYGDFECPFCSRATGSIDEVRETSATPALRVAAPAVGTRAPARWDAARASEAAALQGRFFEMAHQDVRTPGLPGVGALYRYADVGVRHREIRRGPALAARSCTGCRTTRRTPSSWTSLDAHVLRQRRRHQGPWDAAA